MKSKLNITEFRNRIKENTEIGSPRFRLSPFGIFTILGDKPFYGLFDDSNFRLTINSLLFPNFYIVKGQYKNVNNKLDVNYTVEPCRKFTLVWLKYFPLGFLVIFNFCFLLNFKETPLEPFIAFNSFIVFIIFYSRWDIKRKKKSLEQKFIKTFEITQ